MGTRGRLWFIFIFNVILCVLVGLYFFTPLRDILTPQDIRNLKEWIRSYGTIAPLIYMLIMIMGAILCLPMTLMGFIGGITFDNTVGTLTVVVGANLGAMATFLIARALERDIIADFLKGAATKIDESIARHGFYVVAWLRLMPFLPYNIMNYAFGLTKIRLKYLIFGNFIGMFPWAFVMVSLGNATTKISLSDPTVWLQFEVWGPVLLFAILMIFPTVVHGYRKKWM